jgi:alpha-mannosidase
MKPTCEYTQGLFQEIMARTSMIKTRALRAITAQVNLAAIKVPDASAADPAADAGEAMDAGHGNLGLEGAVTHRGPGAGQEMGGVVFNPSPWPRAEVVTARIWNRPGTEQAYQVYDASGRSRPAQVVERGAFWGHTFADVVFPVAVPALGYQAYRLTPVAESKTSPGGCSGDGQGRMENEFFKVEVEQASGAIIHLVDKASGLDLAPPGGRLGLLEYILEAPHNMTAWILGQPLKIAPFLEGASLECPLNGPHRAAVCAKHKWNDSTFKLTIAISAGVPRIDFTLEVNWLERGSPELGVPALKTAFPLAVADGQAQYEIPCGHIRRSTRKAEIVTLTTLLANCYAPLRQGLEMNPAEVPAQKWADLTGRAPGGGAVAAGATLLNDSKYGHSIVDGTIRLTLLRSSYDPDPLPELGQHVIRYALRPHVGEWTVSEATRAGSAFNNPLSVVGAAAHAGRLPPQDRLAELLTPGVMLSGLKKAEDSEALIVRLYEMEGKATTARLWLSERLVRPDAPVVATDLMEQPLAAGTARMENSVMQVEIPAFGLATVKIG